MDKLSFGLFILLLNLSSVFDSLLFKILPIVIFLIILFEESIVKFSGYNILLKRYRVVHVLVIIIIFGIFKTGRDDISFLRSLLRAVTFLSFILALFVVLHKYKNKKDLLSLFVKLVLMPSITFISLNLIIYLIGYREDVYSGSALLFSYLGVSVDRVKFFFSNGINGYGALLGILFNLSLIGLLLKNKFNLFFLIGLLVSLISLLLTDSRGPIIFSLLILGLFKIYLNKIKKPKFLWIIPFIGFVGPLLMLSILTLISNSSYADFFSRSASDLESGNSRLPIWLISSNDFLSFKPQFHIFGYGEFGHFSAGLSQVYGPLVFQHIEKGAEYMHPHNTFISITLDYGYFGLLAFIFFQLNLIKLVKRNWEKNRILASLILANLLYYNLVGIGETIFGFYYQNILYLFFMINIFGFIMNYNLKIKKYV